MGTLNFTVAKYGKARGQGAATLISTDRVTSDAFTTSTAASDVQDGSGVITVAAGDVFRATIDESAWIAFGVAVATVGSDFHMLANIDYEWEVTTAGTVSVIDVS